MALLAAAVGIAGSIVAAAIAGAAVAIAFAVISFAIPIAAIVSAAADNHFRRLYIGHYIMISVVVLGNDLFIG